MVQGTGEQKRPFHIVISKILQKLALIKDTIGGVEAYISAFEDALTSLEEVEKRYYKNLKKMTFLNGILDRSYSALHDILMEDDTKSCTECILALRNKEVGTEESPNNFHPLRRGECMCTNYFSFLELC